MADSTEHPKNIRFFDKNRQVEMIYVHPDTNHWTAGWLLYKGAEGNWVTLRKATEEDVAALKAEMARTQNQIWESLNEKISKNRNGGGKRHA